MIFPTEEAAESRQRLARDMATGRITDEEGCRRLLESDPDDFSALRFFAETALETEDFPEAERRARHMISVHPLGYLGYYLLSRALGEAASSRPLAIAYAQAAIDRLQHDADGLAHFDIRSFAETLGTDVAGLPKAEALAAVAEALRARSGSEPPEVSRELEPHRLILQLYASNDQLLEPAVVDAVVRQGAAIVPLLVGILKEWGAGIIDDEDRTLAERALALLGEIGDPSVLPEITEFLLDPDDYLCGPADWAFRRIAFQRPEAALDRIRAMTPHADGPERFNLAQQIGDMPDVPGRAEVLTSLTAGIDRLPRDEQEAIIVAVITATMMLEGGNSTLAASLEKQFGGRIGGKSRADLRSVRRELLSDGTHSAQASDYTVYQICCEEPEGDDEEPQQVVHATPKRGRNDPCWCGSGKKYKKCHLDLDQRR